MEEKFWSKVEKTDECWLWNGVKDRYGYGRLNCERKRTSAHIFSFLLHGGTIPEDYVVRHKCRNRNCVNPDHLETGTHTENMRDKVRDGTNAMKLTKTQVLEIRERVNETQRKLAKEFNVSQRTISCIISRKLWSWLETNL
jgi:hypothetical protein